MIYLNSSNGIRIALHPFGATWVSCQIPLDDGRREVLLGCRAADLPLQSAYLGATIGRYANRIAGAAFCLGGQRYALSANQDSKHTLHGGADNFSYRNWQVSARSDTHVAFRLHSPDGDQGFVGNLTADVVYTLDNNVVTIDYTAICDRDSVCSLSNHAYFNLDGCGDARRQRLQMNSDKYLPVNSDGMPNAELTHVKGTPFDFRHSKTLAQDFTTVCKQHPVGGYDHAFYFGNNTHNKTAAVLQSADQRVTMTLAMTQPALQCYSGNFLADTPDRNGGVYENYAGIALEPGCLPDSPNHPERLSDCLISADKPYRHRVVYAFDF